MKFALLCKRYYTNKDLLKDRFGRLYHLPVQLGARGHEGCVLAVDYRSNESAALRAENVAFRSLPFRPHRPIAALRRVYRRLGKFRPDIVIASGDTHLGFLGLVLARRLGVPFAFDVYDDYTAFASRRIPGMKWLFYQVVRRADLVICANPILCARLSSSNPSACVIENGVDPALFHPMEKSMARSALGLPGDETVIGFFGSIDTNRGVDTLIEAGRRLRREIPNLRILLAGHDSLKLDFTDPGIDYRGALPQEQVPRLISACDAVVIPYHEDQQVSVSNACKIAEYLACGVPIVATRVSDHAEILAQAPQGLCRPGDPDDLARAIRLQLHAPQRVDFTEQLSWRNLAERLDQSLCALRDGSPSSEHGRNSGGARGVDRPNA
jgi:glycosyltransferase involved in cell wall biosynthesis